MKGLRRSKGGISIRGLGLIWEGKRREDRSAGGKGMGSREVGEGARRL